MDSRLDRYISNEYLVSPCPQAGRNAAVENGSLVDVRSALERAQQTLERLRNGSAHDENASLLLTALEKELSRATALLDGADASSWLS
jgi:uncharacterized protein (DUF1778 family)